MFTNPFCFPFYPWTPNAFTQPLLFDDNLSVVQILAKQAKQIHDLEERVTALETAQNG